MIRLQLKQLNNTSKGYPRYKIENVTEENTEIIEEMLKTGVLRKYKTGIEITRNTDFTLTVKGNCFNTFNNILAFCEIRQ